MKQISIITAASKVALIGAAALLVACGDSANVSPSVTDTTVSGAIVAAPVNGADVSIIDGNGNVVVDSVKTDAAGQYTLKLPLLNLTQDLIVKSTGGTFKDEATGDPGIAGEMYAYASANSIAASSSVSATPGSTIIANLVMNHNKTMAQAEAAFAAAFGYTPDMTITPADATTAPAAGESAASTLAGFRAGAFSQLAMDLGLSQNDQFKMFVALAQDLSVGALDGVGPTGDIIIDSTDPMIGSITLHADIQNRFAMALVDFKASGYNMTALNNAQIGNLPFGKVVFTVDDPDSSNPTSTYQINYEQIGMMGAVDGKTEFKLTVIDRSNAAADTSGLVLKLIPEMHMALMNHSTPQPPQQKTVGVTDNGDGTYTAIIYYVMPSQMMGEDGMSMGYWDLKVEVAGEEAHFHPSVMMTMPSTVQVRLKGVADKAMGMDETTGTMGMVARPYFIFKDDVDAGAGMLSVFIGTREWMMSFPTLLVPGELKKNMMDMSPLVVTDVFVKFSDDVGVTWHDAASAGDDGIWTVLSGLSLTSGQPNEIRVKLMVNTEAKMIDGNDYATFMITP